MKKGNAFFFISTLSAGVIASKVRPLNLMELGLSHKCSFFFPRDKKKGKEPFCRQSSALREKLDLKGRLDVFLARKCLQMFWLIMTYIF